MERRGRFMKRFRWLALAAGAALLLVGGAAAHTGGSGVPDAAVAEGHDEQHGGTGGHLAGSSKNVALVGRVNVADFGPGRTADVAGFGNYAYLAWRNTGPCDPGRVNIVDISNAASPVEVGRITFPPQSFPGEGMQVVRLKTRAFRGDVLVANNENCATTNPARVGGFSLYDVTNPLAPAPLAVGAGDRTVGTTVNPRANQYHSAFAWQQGRRAFVVGVDNAEAGLADVDIFEITDPRNPVLLKETGLPDWPAAQQPLANGSQANHHDMVVKRVRGNWLMLVSYWDAGWVILNVNDPANPVFVNDSDYFEPERELGFSPAEGNAHQAEWTRNNRFIVGTDEDFAPFRVRFQITSGANAGFYQAGEFSFTPRLSVKFPTGLAGPTIWGGSGCVEDTDGNGTSDRDEVPAASALPANPGEAKIVVFTRGVCFFSDKIRTGELKGYDAVIVGQSHGGSGLGARPEGFTCGAQGSPVAGTASAICIGHRATHLLFNDTPEYTPNESTFPDTSSPPGRDLPAIGTLGERIRAETTYDGWGYVRLLDARTLAEIDTYAVSEGVDPAFATGFGTLSVHEVATDPSDSSLAYLSYYDAGLRVIEVGKDGIEEVGHYVDVGGNDFWGVEAHRLSSGDDDDDDEETLILASDRDSGLWIFRYTGGDEDHDDDDD
jgi:hypothetical protein